MKRITVPLIFMLVLLLITPQAVNANAPYIVNLPLLALSDGENITLNGLYASYTLAFSIPNNYQISEGSQLHAKFLSSELLDFERASITILVNGTETKSIRLTSTESEFITIDLAANQLAYGNNTIRFTGALFLNYDEDNNCQNWDDPARWVTLHPSSILDLALEPSTYFANLMDYPDIFVEPVLSNDLNVTTTFIIPDDYTNDDLTALSTAAYQLGATAIDSITWKPEVLFQSTYEENKKINSNTILVNIENEKLAESSISSNNAIDINTSVWNDHYFNLSIRDGERTDGFTPISIFSDPTRKILLNEQIAFIDNFDTSYEASFASKYTFEDIGYLDRTMRGIGEQSIIYKFYVPYNIEIRNAVLKLILTHAPNLDSNDSSFIVAVNGFTVAGILPTARSANLIPIEVSLPANRFRPGINYIRFTFDLQIPENSCTQSPEAVWATIHNSSSIESLYRDSNGIANLKNYPLPFNDSPGVSFIVPDQLTEENLINIVNLAYHLGNTSFINATPPNIIQDSTFLEDMPTLKENQILIGNPKNNQTLARINNILPQPFTKDGKELT